MIPYFQYNAFVIGPVTIQVWGLMVALGIIAAILCTRVLAKKYFLSFDLLLDMAVWILLAAFIFARFFHVVFYAPDFYLANPFDIVKIWEGGASSLGGFFGAALAIWLFAKKRRLSWQQFLPYADVAAVSLWLGWGIGRIGCFLIHDHPGTLTHFVMGVDYPHLVPHLTNLDPNDPPIWTVRHDLGLYESILGFVLFIVFASLFKFLVKKRWGLVALWSSFSYAVVRFFLDFLRATDLPGSDARYAHLTPAQWGMVVLVLTLTSILIFGTLKRPKQAM